MFSQTLSFSPVGALTSNCFAESHNPE